MRARRVRWSAAMAFAVALVLPPGALAAVVRLDARGPSARVVGLVVTGLPGEANRLAVVRGADGAVIVSDTGAPLLPGERCTGGGTTVTCSGGAPDAELNLTISTSDGDDRLALEDLAAYASSYVLAGSGNDVVTGGDGRDELSGDDGDDRLDGGAGADAIGGGLGADVLGGGAGVDSVGYGAGQGPVRVTLDGQPGDGAAGEGDHVLADVENVIGSIGPDLIVGSDGPNRLDGTDGDDVLLGGGGSDRLISESREGGRLVGGPGRDVFVPGLGDAVEARDGEADRVRCSGLARPLTADAVDRLSGCVPHAYLTSTNARADPLGRVELRARCEAIGQPCLMRVEMRYRGVTLARASLRLEAPRDRPVIRLNARGRSLLRLWGELLVTVRVQNYRTRPAPSATRTGWSRITLRG